MSIEERRSYVRVPFSRAVAVAIASGGPVSEASTVDISLGGVRLFSVAPFRLGDTIRIVFRLHHPKRGTSEESVTGRVVHVKTDVDGNTFGIEFMSPVGVADNPELTRTIERL